MKDISDIKDCAVTERGGICQNVDFTDPELLYRELTLNVRKYHPSDDISMIEKAYELSESRYDPAFRGLVQEMLAACDKASTVDPEDPYAMYEVAEEIAESYDRMKAIIGG